MKRQHSISGTYFRQQNLDTNKWENVCFEDLEDEKQMEVLNLSRGKEEWYKGMIKILTTPLHELVSLYDDIKVFEKQRDFPTQERVKEILEKENMVDEYYIGLCKFYASLLYNIAETYGIFTKKEDEE